MSSNFRNTFQCSLLLCATVGCQSTVIIKTEPPGAKVYAEGALLGESPVFYGDEKISGSTTELLIKKDGCEPFEATIARTKKIDIGALIGGLFLVVPFLWVLGYQKNQTFELTCTPPSP